MKSLKKEYLSNVIPSVFSFFLGAVYCLCDAFFIGNRVGDLGLAAVNISFSFLSVFIAAGSAIGMGAAVKYSILKARNQESDAEDYIWVSYNLMLICSVIITLPCIFFPQFFLLILGASGNVADLGKNYFRICATGAFFQIFACGMPPICRNLNGAIASMMSFVSGCVVNIFLDWLFVWQFGWGLEGAAAATIIGQILSFAVCLVFLMKKKMFYFSYKGNEFGKICWQICKIGISPFGLTIVPNISVIVLNKASLYYGQDIGLAAYGCMAYLVYLVYMVIQGVTDGAQSLISTYYGKSDFNTLNRIKKYTYFSSLFVATVSFFIEVYFRKYLGPFMGCSAQASTIIEKGLPVFAIGFFFVAFSRSTASCLYACEKNLKSYIISYTEPIFITISVFLFNSAGLDGVWLSNTIGQFAVAAVSLLL